MNKKFHKTNTPCRNCGHLFYNHVLYTEVRQGPMTQDFILVIGDFVPCNEYAPSGGVCRCIKWETSDNLEWLETKAVEQEKKDDQGH